MPNGPIDDRAPLNIAPSSLNWAYGVVILFAAAVPVAFFLDLPVADFLLSNKERVPGDLDKLINLSEVMGHGLGVAAILLTIFVLDSAARRKLIRAAVSIYLPGLIVSVLKRVIGRERPAYFFQNSAGADQPSVWDTFIVTGSGFRVESIPSGHATVAAAAAIALSWLYPRGWWLFACFAALAATQRMYVGAHYLSDVCAGAAVGGLFALLYVDERAFGRLFTRFERGRTD